ncbi:MAG: 50S ribosomal protein L21 [Deltaproteobacteria bacterium]|nr:50S ribosomal protein L21 [Deltaproteobacteria bacterium]
MQAVIQTGGKQYNVSKGERLLVEKIPGEPGTEISFDQVLLVHGDATSGVATKIGLPYVAGAKVTGKIVAQKKGEKVVSYKYKRRKGYHKKQGHRQLLTEVQIDEIRG